MKIKTNPPPPPGVGAKTVFYILPPADLLVSVLAGGPRLPQTRREFPPLLVRPPQLPILDIGGPPAQKASRIGIVLWLWLLFLQPSNKAS